MALFRPSPRLFTLFTFSCCSAVRQRSFAGGNHAARKTLVAIANFLVVRHYEGEFQRLCPGAVLGIKS